MDCPAAQKDRIAVRCPAPGLMVTTRKIAARVNGVATGCGIADGPPDALGVMGAEVRLEC